jgi:hypothetical protein
VIEADKSFMMFPSWKQSREQVITLTNAAGLEIETLGKAGNSDMYQYLTVSGPRMPTIFLHRELRT